MLSSDFTIQIEKIFNFFSVLAQRFSLSPPVTILIRRPGDLRWARTHGVQTYSKVHTPTQPDEGQTHRKRRRGLSSLGACI